VRTDVAAATSAGDPVPVPAAAASADAAALVALEQTTAPTWPGSFPEIPTDPSRRITVTIWLRASRAFATIARSAASRSSSGTGAR